MLSENREFHYTGSLKLNKSIVLNAPNQPKDDKVNWLFLQIEERKYSFLYKILEPLKAEYNKPFTVKLSFTMIEVVKNIIKLNNTYTIFRGNEYIGTLNMKEIL